MTDSFRRFPAAPTFAPAAPIRAWAKRFADLARARRANRDFIRRTADMYYLDDRTLEDIGVTRDDLRRVEAELRRRG